MIYPILFQIPNKPCCSKMRLVSLVFQKERCCLMEVHLNHRFNSNNSFILVFFHSHKMHRFHELQISHIHIVALPRIQYCYDQILNLMQQPSLISVLCFIHQIPICFSKANHYYIYPHSYCLIKVSYNGVIRIII